METCTVMFIMGAIVAFILGLLLDVDSFAGGLFSKRKDSREE